MSLTNPEAELKLINGLIDEGGGPCLNKAYLSGLKPHHFSDMRNQETYASIIAVVFQEQVSLSAVSLSDMLAKKGWAGCAFSQAYIFPGDAEACTDILKDLSAKRELLQISERMAEDLAHTEETAFELMTRYGTSMNNVITPPEQEQSTPEILKEVMDDIDAAVEAGGPTTRALTGFPKFDKASGGLLPGGLYIVSAQPGAGKTTFCSNIARHNAQRGVKVAYYTLEQPRKAILAGMIGQLGGINMHMARIGRCTANRKRLEQISAEVEAMALTVRDKPMTPDDFMAMAKRDVEEGGHELIIVDYLQHLKQRKGCSSPIEHAEDCSRALTESAKSLNVAIIAVSSLSNDGNLRYSKQIEFDCTLLFKLERADDWCHANMRIDGHILKSRYAISFVDISYTMNTDGTIQEDGDGDVTGEGETQYEF